jgi:hypothetical protein
MFVSSEPAGATGNGIFSIAPTTAPGSNPIQFRPFFNPQLQPGGSASDSVTVTNETASPMTLRLYAADAFNTSNGAFSIRPRYWPKNHMGAWIQLPIGLVTLPGHSADLIPFSYSVPSDVTPGDYAGGIVAEQTQSTPGQNGSVHIGVLQAVGVAVFGRVAGPLHPDLAVTAVSIGINRSIASQFGGAVDATVKYSVTNTGNQNLRPKVKVALSPLFGGGQSHVAQLRQVLPGSTVTFVETFKNVVPFGYLSATVTANALGMQSTATSNSLVIPWGLVAILVILVVFVWWMIRRRRRRGAELET